jgi:ribosomal protein S18 acetylase RimI-like enzyme
MSHEAIAVRKAVEGDVECLTSLLIELFSIETDFHIDREKHAKGILLVLRGGERSIMFVAEKDGCIVGMVSGQIVISTAEGALSVLLEDLCVSAAFKRSRVGTALVDNLVAWAREKGAVRMQLVADSGNHPALKFYEKKNFNKSRMVALYRSL